MSGAYDSAVSWAVCAALVHFENEHRDFHKIMYHKAKLKPGLLCDVSLSQADPDKKSS